MNTRDTMNGTFWGASRTFGAEKTEGHASACPGRAEARPSALATWPRFFSTLTSGRRSARPTILRPREANLVRQALRLPQQVRQI